MFRNRVVLSLLGGVALLACEGKGGEDPERVQKALAAQEAELQQLSGLLAGQWADVAGVTEATAAERAAVEAKVEKFHSDFAARWQGLDAPVDEAQSALDTAKKALSGQLAQVRVHDTNERQGKAWCGGDGCTGSCGARCAVSEVCFEDQCACVPQCNGRSCGMDGCGGYCGTRGGNCAEGESCTAEGRCQKLPAQEVACVPSCDLKGRPLVAGGLRPQREGVVLAAWQVRLAGSPVSDVASLGAWVRALEGREVALSTQLKEVEQLAEKAQAATRARDVAQEKVAAAVTAQKDAAAAARAAKLKPAEAPDLVKANEALAAAQGELKTAAAELQRLNAEMAQRRAQADTWTKARERIRGELQRLGPVSTQAKGLEAAVEEAQRALEAATEARSRAQEALVAELSPEAGRLEQEFRRVTQPVLRGSDTGLAGCEEDKCELAGKSRVEACSQGADGPGCAKDPAFGELLSRLKASAAARKQALADRAGAPGAAEARAKLDAALSAATRRALLLEGADGTLSSALQAVVAGRTRTGGVRPEALRALAELQGKLGEKHLAGAEVKAVLEAAAACREDDALESEQRLLLGLVGTLERTLAAHGTWSHLVQRVQSVRAGL
ncbi:MAG: hypothetical protein RL653_503 [Pseudomonadota bacterium]|jgi:hypothetical protein